MMLLQLITCVLVFTPNLAFWTDAPKYECETGWELFRGRCYKFEQLKKWKSPEDIQSICAALDAEIITVPSRKHDDYFLNYLNKHDMKYLLIGLRYENGTGTWRWPDGSEPCGRYSNWSSSSSSKPFWHGWESWCASLSRGSEAWQSRSCYDSLFGISACERPGKRIN